jgi:AcrR family transcriptional regulator
VFRQRGIDASFDDVARHAGVGVGTVYRRFASKEALIDALLDEMTETVVVHLNAALREADTWVGLTEGLTRVCEEQSRDRGLREVMLGTGRHPGRQAQIGERTGPLIDELLTRARRHGKIRADIVPADLTALQVMVAAVTEHNGEPEQWRRYLMLLLEGLRACPRLATPLRAR